MKKFLMLQLALVLLLLSTAPALAQCALPTPTPDPNRHRIIDARPNRVFAANGKTRFGDKGKVFIINMNPFLFDGYRITIQEEEIKDEALVKFIKALIPVAGQFAENAKAESAREQGQRPGDINLNQLIERLKTNPMGFPETCGTDQPCLAMDYMIKLKDQLVLEQETIRNYFIPPDKGGPTYLKKNFLQTKRDYITYGAVLFNRDTETAALCTAANALHKSLTAPEAYPTQDEVTEKQQAIENMVSKAKDLKKTVDLYKAQDHLKNKKWIGSTGFDYLEDLDLFAQELINSINAKYTAKARDLLGRVIEYDNMKEAITNLQGRENTLLRQEFAIGGKYDFSKVTVTVQPFGEKTPQDVTKKEVTRNGDAPVGNDPALPGQNGGGPSSPPNTGSGPNAAESAAAGNGFTEAAGSDNKAAAAASPTPANSPSKITDVMTTGKPRFEIGVGMAYSQVEKRRFQVVSGFARDRDGNLTNGETFTNIVGFSEQTDHRFTPVALLHTRLTNNPKYNLYFSLGITGSRDQLGTNIEYLIGPSVNVTDNIFLTVGAFAGRQHNLAGEDLFVGAGVPSGFDTIPVRSRYQWKPGFSFSYRLPVFGTSKKKAAAESAAPALDTYTDTLYAGEPRFSISAGMAYSQLRQQSFQPIIGFARNREGALTNGETFTRVVGFTENSDSRFLPMALLNTRIMSNEQVGLHFSLGITAKRTNENTDVEYLVGPSFSFMKNQIIFTAGAYAGKQDNIAGDLFMNAALPSGVTLRTQREYHFKPGIAFSYRLPIKLP